MNDDLDPSRPVRPLPERHRNKVFPELWRATNRDLAELRKFIDDGTSRLPAERENPAAPVRPPVRKRKTSR